MHTSPQEKLTTQTRTLYMALELSATTWKLAFSDRLCRRPRARSSGRYARRPLQLPYLH